MELKNRKFVASYSGGKDSILAIYRAIRQGMQPVGLITTYQTERDCSWFHSIPKDVISEVAQSLNIPVTLIKTTGENYENSFKKELKRQKEKGASVCVFGDIDIEEHLEWCTNICKESGISAHFPLWHESREALVKEFISEGFSAYITIVDTSRLSEKHLGVILSEEALQSIQADGADICGENGEYHSFVFDGPIFSRSISVAFGEIMEQGPIKSLPIIRRAFSETQKKAECMQHVR